MKLLFLSLFSLPCAAFSFCHSVLKLQFGALESFGKHAKSRFSIPLGHMTLQISKVGLSVDKARLENSALTNIAPYNLLQYGPILCQLMVVLTKALLESRLPQLASVCSSVWPSWVTFAVGFTQYSVLLPCGVWSFWLNCWAQPSWDGDPQDLLLKPGSDAEGQHENAILPRSCIMGFTLVPRLMRRQSVYCRPSAPAARV